MGLIVAGSLWSVGQGSIAAAAVSTGAPANTVAFKPLGRDAVVARKLLAAQNLVVVDGARAVPAARPLAHRIEQLDRFMESLCSGIIHDADSVAAARRDVRRAPASARPAPDQAPGDLSAILDRAAADVKQKMDALTGSENISISDMFEMQMLMNRLSQLSEMATSVASATNSAIASMARNVKS
ncbi:MAG: DUF5407 family protein [Solirubrobacterales bacterium]|nr:DUF5407 family protein [Solirubrobacterales bacterium]